MEDQQLRRSGSQIWTLPIFLEHWRAKENGEVSEVAAIKNHLSHTSLPQAKQKSLPESKGSLGMEVRRESRREETPDNSPEMVPQFLRNIKAKYVGAKWVEMG